MDDRQQYIQRMRDMERWVANSVCPSLAEKKREFQELIEELFEPVIKSGKEHKKFEWICVYRFYKYYKTDLTDLYSLRIFCAFVFKLFFTFDCPDVKLIFKILHMYQQVQKEYDDLGICDNCRNSDNPKHYFYEEFVDTRPILKKVNKKVPDTYAFNNREFYSKLTVDAIYEGDYPFLQFLVKYGLSYFPADLMNHAKDLLEKLSSKYYILKHFENNKENNVRLAEEILQRYTTTVERPNLRRLILIVRTLNVALRMRLGDSYYPDYVKCLNLYVQTVPETAISMNDVEDFLSFAFTEPNDRTFVDETCSDFKKVFPESASLPTPRPLKYLCRCKVRDCISNTPTLTSVLSEMEIPSSMKDYVLFMSK